MVSRGTRLCVTLVAGVRHGVSWKQIAYLRQRIRSEDWLWWRAGLKAALRLKKTEEEFLKYSRVARVATADERGMPHVVPVCHLWERGCVYFGTARESKKVHNLQRNSQIALAVDDYTDAWAHLRGLLLQGHAQLVSRGAQFRRIRKLLYQKFPQYEKEAALEEDAIIVCFVPKRAVSWGL